MVTFNFEYVYCINTIDLNNQHYVKQRARTYFVHKAHSLCKELSKFALDYEVTLNFFIPSCHLPSAAGA